MDIRSIKLFLFDMDGTLYLGNELFPFTKELLSVIKSQGRYYLFMTNNSSKSVEAYIKKLAKLGIAAEYDDFITSSQATADYLNKNYPGYRFYVMGTESFKKELSDSGISITDIREGKIDGVVAGFDTELTFKKLEDVSILLTEDMPFIAANPDLVCPTEFGYVPDCGSVCAMITNATGKVPYYIGKPRPDMMLSAVARMGSVHGGITTDNTLVIGDRIYTDIACGLNGGAHTLLVMSGETTYEILEKSERKPEAVMSDCGELLKELIK